jgi:hypothetical protein
MHISPLAAQHHTFVSCGRNGTPRSKLAGGVQAFVDGPGVQLLHPDSNRVAARVQNNARRLILILLSSELGETVVKKVSDRKRKRS